MAVVKPLKLKQEKVQAWREPALQFPFAQILVDHRVPHLDQRYEYSVPELLSERVVTGTLVEIEFGSVLTQGIVLGRNQIASTGGTVKEILKVISDGQYLRDDQIALVTQAATLYGTNPWDLVRTSIPPFSKLGEKESVAPCVIQEVNTEGASLLPDSLQNFLESKSKITCAVELPSATPYWELLAMIALERRRAGKVLILLPNERELNLVERVLIRGGELPIKVLGSQGKSERYKNYLLSRTAEVKVILGLRSSALLSLPINSTIIVLDDVDSSHYERQSPTWNTRDLVHLREGTHSTIYASTSLSLEIADRVISESLPLYRFPPPPAIKFHSTKSGEIAEYFNLIGEGLRRGSVLVSMGSSGYITSFSCQKCRNLALCRCGGKLYFAARNANPLCSTCATVYLEWSCPWCHESKPRIVRSGVIRRAEEFGKAFANHSVIHSSAQNPVHLLPEGKHLVLSTPGVEPRGIYSAQIFLDLEGWLMRTTLRTTEEVRAHLLRNLAMIMPGGDVFIDLQPADSFLQSILRSNLLLAAERELEERDGACFLPHFTNILLFGEPLEMVERVLAALPEVEILGPFLRNGKKAALIKAPRFQESAVVELLRAFNRVRSMRKEGLLTYQINPYSLN